jgi:hypothetical protein
VQKMRLAPKDGKCLKVFDYITHCRLHLNKKRGDEVVKKVMDFAKKHPAYVGTIHALGGLGVGFIIAHYFSGMNLVLWGVILIVVSLMGHLYMWIV